MARGEAKDEGIHARLEVPRSEATRLREPGVNAFILGVRSPQVICAAKPIAPTSAGLESTWLVSRNFLFQKKLRKASCLQEFFWVDGSSCFELVQ